MSNDAAKREERRRRILERGSDRLSRITGTGRGEDYDLLDASTQGGVAAGVAAAPGGEARGAAPKATVADGAEEALAHVREDATAMMPDAFTSMLADMQARAGDAATDQPAPDAVQMMQQILGRGMTEMQHPMSAPTQAAVPPAALERAARVDRRLRLGQSVIVSLFAFYLVFSSIFHATENAPIVGRALEKEASGAFAQDSFFKQWAALAYEYTPINAWLSGNDPRVFPWGALQTPFDTLRPYLGARAHVDSLPSWPVFWVFFSLEVALQGIRFAMMERFPATPPSGVASALMLYAPQLVSYLSPVLAFANLASAMVDDVCILIFAIGVGILFCQWRVGA
ncbi:hypothetical protein MSPP1_001025 [Malassezia sp. CBS 17886]|nr:hypothetical protein MSPP1_001025 [Malassezia sp. CBS 17886]